MAVMNLANKVAAEVSSGEHMHFAGDTQISLVLAHIELVCAVTILLVLEVGMKISGVFSTLRGTNACCLPGPVY